jgi:hypothetical protein
MILAELTVNDTLQRIGDGWYNLDHKWRHYIWSLSSLKLSLSGEIGGLVEPSFSDITLSPEAFDNAWPPPPANGLVIKQASTVESDAVQLFSGVAHVDEIEREGISCILYPPDNDVTLVKGASYSGTLVSVATTLAAALGLTVDSTDARSPSPAISHTLTADSSCRELLGRMLEYTAHAGREVDGVLRIVDMKSFPDPILLKTYTAFVMPSRYNARRAVSSVKAGNVSVSGIYGYGDDRSVTAYHTTESVVKTELNNVLYVAYLARAEIDMVIDGICPTILDVIRFTDTSLHKPATFAGRVIDVIYNFDDQVMNLTCIGWMA